MITPSLRDMVRNAGIRQREVAVALRVSTPQACRYLSGITRLPADHVAPIAALLGVPVADVLAIVRSCASNADECAAHQPSPTSEAA